MWRMWESSVSHLESVAHPGIELKQHLHFTDHAERNVTELFHLQSKINFKLSENSPVVLTELLPTHPLTPLCCRYRRISLDRFIPPRCPRSSCPAQRTRTTQGGVTGWRCLTRSACEIESLTSHTGTWVRLGSCQACCPGSHSADCGLSHADATRKAHAKEFVLLVFVFKAEIFKYRSTVFIP